MKLCSICLIFLSTSRIVNCFQLAEPTAKNVIAETLTYIIENKFCATSSSVDINIGYLNRRGIFFARDILSHVLVKTHVCTAVRIANSPGNDIKTPRKHNIILVDSIKSFDQFSKHISNKVYDFEGYFLIVLMASDIDLHEALYHIFQTLFNLFIINVNVVHENKSRANVYTFFPFTRQHCNKVSPSLYNTFRNGSFVRPIDIFPDKLTNFHGCGINVLTWSFGPHIYLIKHENGTIVTEGIDGFILQALQKDFNFSINYIFTPVRDDRGTILPNGTATGAHKMMLDGDGNLTICGYGYTDFRALHFTASRYYYYSAFVVVKPGQPKYTSIERLFFPFDIIVWWCITFTFVIGFIVIHLLKAIDGKHLNFLVGKANNAPFLQMFNTALGGSAIILPKNNFGRTILALWMLINLVLRSSYQGLLFGFLQKTQYKIIPLTLNGLLEIGYGIYAPKSFVTIFNSAQVPEYEAINLPMEPYILRTQDPLYKRTLITTHFQISRYNSENWSRPAIDILPERLLLLPMVVLYQKNSYMKTPFDRTLQKLIGSGLIDHWASRYMNRTAKHDEVRSDIKPISVADFSGTFLLCGIILAVALFVFVLEILSVKYPRLQRIIHL